MALGLGLALAAGCGASLGRDARAGEWEEGLAVYYSDALQGHKTANGETYDKAKLTAAHLRLPLGSIVRVLRLSDRRSVEVRVNDRGPFGDSDRIIDLSRAAAERLGMIGDGIVRVRVEVVELPGEK